MCSDDKDIIRAGFRETRLVGLGMQVECHDFNNIIQERLLAQLSQGTPIRYLGGGGVPDHFYLFHKGD